MAPPANNLIMSGTSIRSFRHLEHQNPSIIKGDIGRAIGCKIWDGTDGGRRTDTLQYYIGLEVQDATSPSF